MSAEDYFGSFENDNDYEDNPDLVKRKRCEKSSYQSHYASQGYSLVETSNHSESEYWKTRDGELILISKMTDTHLLNAYKKCKDKRLRNEMLIRLFSEHIKKVEEIKCVNG